MKKCLEFTYNGCKGNSNRFLSKEECKNNCLIVGGASGHSTSGLGGKNHFKTSSSNNNSNYIIIEVIVGVLVVMLLTIGFGLGVKYYKLYREGNDNYRLFQNQQQLQRHASTVSTLAYENPVYETENSFQMNTNSQQNSNSANSVEIHKK